MKTLVTTSLVLIICFLWVGSAYSIDKTSKSGKNKKPNTVVVDDTNKSGQQDSQIQSTDKTGSRSKKTYDDFIDANNNGIDDRAEKKAISGKSKKPDPDQSDSKKKKQ